MLNIKTLEVTSLSHISGNPNSFPSNSVRCLYYDKNGAVWAGSLRDGIINIQKGFIKTYVEVADGSKYGLSNPTVLSLYKDKNSNDLWIGTDGKGINKFCLIEKTFTHYDSTAGYKVASFAKYTEDELLLSFYLEGFHLFNKKNGKLRKINIDDEHINKRAYYTETTVNLYNDGEDGILFLTDKIQRYNKKDGTVKTILADGREYAKGYYLVVGEHRGNLYFYDRNTVYRMLKGDSVMKSIYTSKSKIACASLSQTGVIWIAEGNTISYISPDEMQKHTLGSALPESVTSVLEDKKGIVWIGAENKLYAYLKEDDSFVLLGPSQGVRKNEYLRKPNILTEDGDICMGGNNGLLFIDKDFKIDEQEQPKVILTDITLDGKNVIKNYDTDVKELSLPWSSKFLEISVMSLEKDILRPKKFRFEIIGTNAMVVETSSPVLKLSSLLQGRNSIYVSCSSRKGLWTRPVELVTLDVLPPWYRTWWFILICAIMLFVITVSIFYSVLRRKENIMKMALKERERDMYEEKVRFLINMSHELRTPLTLIHAPLKRILSNMKSGNENFVKLSKIYRQSGRMKKLLDMVLDLRKLEMGENVMHVGEYNVNEWVQEVMDDFVAEGEALGIKIRTELDWSIGKLRFDKDKLEVVLTNLIVNALKHSTDSGEIVIKTESWEDGKSVKFSVIDNGVGLAGVDVNKLFTRFYQGSNETYGTGIGLSYSKVIVELHSGEIGAGENISGIGAVFFFIIPYSFSVPESGNNEKAYLNEIIASDEDVVVDAIHDDYDTLDSVVLFVDDSVELLEFMVETFEQKFKKILTATNGRDALAIMSKTIPDVIVSDVMMPDMNGYELCSYIKNKEDFCHIPVVLLTARSEENSKKLGYKIGAEAFLAKPFEVDTLYEIIRGTLRYKSMTKQFYMNLSTLPEVKVTSGIDEVFLLKLNNIIMDNISNIDLDINFICKELVMSRASFYNKIKSVTNISGNEYINKVRLEYAISLIKTTDLNFTEISEKSGFASSKYFSTSFKQYTGMTPTQYKRTFKNKQQ